MRDNILGAETADGNLPEKIYVEASSRCNLNCLMCFRHSWIDESPGEMELPLFLKLASEIREMPSVKEVFFGGMGEPLFNGNICRMLAAVPQHIKKSLITNGTILDENMSERLIESGLDELWISVDGYSMETYSKIQRGSEFDRICNNIATFNRLRKGRNVRLCITFVITSENEAELDRIDDFADRFDIDEINVSHEIPGHPVEEGYLCGEERYPLGKMRRLSEGIIGAEEDRCPFIDNNAVFIKWNGDVIPCMQLLHSCRTYLYDEQRTITSFSYGNLHESSLLDCWNRDDYSRFRKRVREFYFPFCRHCEGCEDRKQNLTDCFLTESPACGACLWASGRVFCP